MDASPASSPPQSRAIAEIGRRRGQPPRHVLADSRIQPIEVIRAVPDDRRVVWSFVHRADGNLFGVEPETASLKPPN